MYLELFTPSHIAMLHDWLSETGELFVWLEFPHSGGSGFSFSVSSLEELKELISKQTHPEIEIFIFKEKEIDDEELDRRLDLKWIYRNAERSLYLAVTKNRNYYEVYAKHPERYKDALAIWQKQA